MTRGEGVTNFHTIRQGQEFFRQMWKKALCDGLRPGQQLREHDLLDQLAQGHPDYAEMAEHGVAYFTIQPDGRGNHRFVLVDKRGNHHPFSTLAALRGAKTPLRLPLEAESPFKDLR